MTPELAERLARIVLSCIGREYPNQIAHTMTTDADAAPPRSLHPAFFGCYDWHSAVHAHWCLVRLLRVTGGARDWGADARRALRESLTEEKLLGELAYLDAEGRGTFERPYGLAWALRLDAELRMWRDDAARACALAMRPLAAACSARLAGWAAALTHPVRTGVHSQSAFALSLALDWARLAGEDAAADLLAREARRLYSADRGWALAFEPSGEDFLSPSLAEADLMRRVLPPGEFAAWLGGFLPELGSAGRELPLAPVRPLDPLDGRLAHLDGLSLSRAWMLDGIADALAPGDPRAGPIRRAADAHLHAGLARVDADDYARAHWLATFAAYALTREPAAEGITPPAS